MRCANCANHRLVAIRLVISSEPVSLHRCPRCDTHTWSGREGELTRESVLELVRAGR